MKIIYSLNNSLDSQIFLSRFLNFTKNHTIKVCMYGISDLFQVDFNLNYFLGEQNKINIQHPKVVEYFDLIQKINPDLIISDNDILTSYIAGELNIKLINCSYYFLPYLVNTLSAKESNSQESFLINSIINNKNNYCPFFIPDIDFEFTYNKLYSNNFKYIRPYFKIGNKTKEKNIHTSLFDKSLFNEHEYNFYSCNSNEYFNSIASSKCCKSELNYTFVIDNFYNQKYTYFSKPKTMDDLALSVLLKKCRLGEIYNNSTKEEFVNCLQYSEIKFLHEVIKEI